LSILPGKSFGFYPDYTVIRQELTENIFDFQNAMFRCVVHRKNCELLVAFLRRIVDNDPADVRHIIFKGM